MYYTVLKSSLFGLRMGKIYLSAIAVSATLFFSSSALSDQEGTADDQLLENRQCVILLHGLSRSKHSMGKMEQALVDAGYSTANIDYPSRTMKIQDLAPLAMHRGSQAMPGQKVPVPFILLRTRWEESWPGITWQKMN